MSKESDRDTERWGKIKKAMFGEDIQKNSPVLLEFYSILLHIFHQENGWYAPKTLMELVENVLAKTQYSSANFQDYTKALYGLLLFTGKDCKIPLYGIFNILQLDGSHWNHRKKLCLMSCSPILAGYILALLKLIEDVYWWDQASKHNFTGQFAEIIAYCIRHGGRYVIEHREPMETHANQIIDVKKFQGQVSQQLKTHLSGINQDYTKALLENALRSLGFSLEVFPPNGLGLIIFQEMVYAYIGALSPHEIHQKLF